jgi:hypothetical protein
MRLGSKWRIGQHKSAGYESRRGNRERTTWWDVERILRRRMRIFPGRLRDRALAAEEEEDDRDLGHLDLRLPTGGRAAADWGDPEVKRESGKEIISIDGRDLDEGELDLDEPEAITR